MHLVEETGQSTGAHQGMGTVILVLETRQAKHYQECAAFVKQEHLVQRSWKK